MNDIPPALAVIIIVAIFVVVWLIVRFVFIPLLLGDYQTKGDREWNRHVSRVESGKEPHTPYDWAAAHGYEWVNGHMEKVKWRD